MARSVSELLQFPIHLEKLIVLTPHLLRGGSAVRDIRDNTGDTNNTAFLAGDGGSAFRQLRGCSVIGAMYTEFGIIDAALTAHSLQLFPVLFDVIGMDESKALDETLKRCTKHAAQIAFGFDFIPFRIPLPNQHPGRIQYEPSEPRA